MLLMETPQQTKITEGLVVMPRGRKANVALIDQWKGLLEELVLPRFDAIESNLRPRLDQVEDTVREHTGQIRELYSICAVLRAQQEKKS